MCSSRSRLTHDSLLLPLEPRGDSLPPSVSSNSMNSLVVEEVYFSKAKLNRLFSTPGRNCHSITPSAHNRRSHDNRASKSCTRPTPRLAAIARPAVTSVFPYIFGVMPYSTKALRISRARTSFVEMCSVSAVVTSQSAVPSTADLDMENFSCARMLRCDVYTSI